MWLKSRTLLCERLWRTPGEREGEREKKGLCHGGAKRPQGKQLPWASQAPKRVVPNSVCR